VESIILFSLLFLFLFIGVPVAVSLGLSSVLVIAIFSQDSVSSVALQLFTASQKYTLLAIPFFILASAFMSTGGVAKRIIRFSVATVGHFRGGLAIASVFACMLFAALSGSSPATVVAIGTIAITAMRQVGYTKDFAAGVVANAGTLGILIPPSIVMVVYAAATDVSVGRMFLAGVIPGLMAGFLLMLVIYINARIRKMPSRPFAGMQEIFRSGIEAAGGLLLIFIILGGIYGGVFTPTEAAAVAAVYSFLIAIFIYRDMGPLKEMPWVEESDSEEAILGFHASAYAFFAAFFWALMCFLLPFFADMGYSFSLVLGGLVFFTYPLVKNYSKNPLSVFGLFMQSLPIWGRNVLAIIRVFLPSFFNSDTRTVMLEGAKTTIMLMFIIVNALVFSHVLVGERIPDLITDLMLDAGFTWWQFLIVVNIILLIGGQFMEPSGLLLIVAPVVFPIAIELGIDPIHLGVMMVVNMEIGMITPPIGLNLFVTSGVTGMSMARVVKAALPFGAVLFLCLILVTYIPSISTWLPISMMGPEIITR
jgi:C4-dicarboxylate transporter DctM subunit